VRSIGALAGPEPETEFWPEQRFWKAVRRSDPIRAARHARLCTAALVLVLHSGCVFEADGEENEMMGRVSFSAEEAQQVGEGIGVDWSSAPFDIEQFRMGMDVELEHGLHDLLTNVTDGDPVVTGKIALAHLKEFPDYYTRLARMEEEAKRDSLTTSEDR
jgi:hypothetical protein